MMPRLSIMFYVCEYWICFVLPGVGCTVGDSVGVGVGTLLGPIE